MSRTPALDAFTRSDLQQHLLGDLKPALVVVTSICNLNIVTPGPKQNRT